MARIWINTWMERVTKIWIDGWVGWMDDVSAWLDAWKGGYF